MSTPPPADPGKSPSLPPRRKGRRWKTAGLGLLLLVCGAVMGSGITVLAARKLVVDAMRDPDRFPRFAAARAKRHLGLSDEQTSQVREILIRRFHAIRRIRAESRPRIEEQIARMNEEVAAVLDERQAARWRERVEAIRRMLPPPVEPPAAPETGGN